MSRHFPCKKGIYPIIHHHQKIERKTLTRSPDWSGSLWPGRGCRRGSGSAPPCIYRLMVVRGEVQVHTEMGAGVTVVGGGDFGLLTVR
jgi:hypothetical protein